jgi:hypothetical protein
MSEPEFTRGPWEWFGNAQSNTLYLATRHGGRRYVMKFRRWGMTGAQPVFQPHDRMVNAKDLLMFEVGEKSVRGMDQAKADGSVYRYDIRGVDAPDAYLIAAAPCLYEALDGLLQIIDDGDGNQGRDDARLAAMEKAREVLARARGGQ